MKLLQITAALTAVALASGCATVTRGTKHFFEINSEPPGATVELSNGVDCTTPCGMELPRKRAFSATFTMAGYKPLQVEVRPRQAAAGSAGMAGNVLIGGLIGVVTDATTGAMKDLHPNPLIVRLAPESSDEESVVILEDEDADEKAAVASEDEVIVGEEDAADITGH